MLDAAGSEVREERHAKKAPLAEAEVRALLRQVDEVVLAKGKSLRREPASAIEPDALRGPTGSFRAPMVRVGRLLMVGLSEDELRRTLRGPG